MMAACAGAATRRLARHQWGARIPAAGVKREFGIARHQRHTWGDSPQN